MKVTLLKLYQTSYISHDRNQTSRVPKIPGIFQRSIHLVSSDLALLSRQVITVIGQQRSCFIGPRKIHSRSRAARQREKEVRTVESGKKKHRQLKEGSGKGRKGCEGGKQKGERGGGGGEEEKREVAFTAAWTGVRDAREPFTCRRHTFFLFLSFFFFLSFPPPPSAAKRRRARKGTAARERSFEKLSRRAERSHNARVSFAFIFQTGAAPRRRSLVSQAFARLSRSSSLYERWGTSLKTFSSRVWICTFLRFLPPSATDSCFCHGT